MNENRVTVSFDTELEITKTMTKIIKAALPTGESNRFTALPESWYAPHKKGWYSLFIGVPGKSKDFLGKGGAAGCMSFRARAKAKESKLATTRRTP